MSNCDLCGQPMTLVESGDDCTIERCDNPECGDVSVTSTLDDREKTHGSFLTQAVTARDLKEVLFCAGYQMRLAPYQQEALDMIMTKVSRILHGDSDEPDHWHDIAGYATLVLK
jgi:hypothetical protein